MRNEDDAPQPPSSIAPLARRDTHIRHSDTAYQSPPQDNSQSALPMRMPSQTSRADVHTPLQSPIARPDQRPQHRLDRAFLYSPSAAPVSLASAPPILPSVPSSAPQSTSSSVPTSAPPQNLPPPPAQTRGPLLASVTPAASPSTEPYTLQSQAVHPRVSSNAPASHAAEHPPAQLHRFAEHPSSPAARQRYRAEYPHSRPLPLQGQDRPPDLYVQRPPSHVPPTATSSASFGSSEMASTMYRDQREHPRSLPAISESLPSGPQLRPEPSASRHGRTSLHRVYQQDISHPRSGHQPVPGPRGPSPREDGRTYSWIPTQHAPAVRLTPLPPSFRTGSSQTDSHYSEQLRGAPSVQGQRVLTPKLEPGTEKEEVGHPPMREQETGASHRMQGLPPPQSRLPAHQFPPEEGQTAGSQVLHFRQEAHTQQSPREEGSGLPKPAHLKQRGHKTSPQSVNYPDTSIRLTYSAGLPFASHPTQRPYRWSESYGETDHKTAIREGSAQQIGLGKVAGASYGSRDKHSLDMQSPVLEHRGELSSGPHLWPARRTFDGRYSPMRGTAIAPSTPVPKDQPQLPAVPRARTTSSVPRTTGSDSQGFETPDVGQTYHLPELRSPKRGSLSLFSGRPQSVPHSLSIGRPDQQQPPAAASLREVELDVLRSGKRAKRDSDTKWDCERTPQPLHGVEGTTTGERILHPRPPDQGLTRPSNPQQIPPQSRRAQALPPLSSLLGPQEGHGYGREKGASSRTRSFSFMTSPREGATQSLWDKEGKRPLSGDPIGSDRRSLRLPDRPLSFGMQSSLSREKPLLGMSQDPQRELMFRPPSEQVPYQPHGQRMQSDHHQSIPRAALAGRPGLLTDRPQRSGQYQMASAGDTPRRRGSQHSCKFCPYRAHQSSDLKRHLATHQDLRPYKCTECEFAFRQKAHLNAHLNARHNRLKPHECDICHRRFAARSSLKRHVTYVHNNRNPAYTCPDCAQPFSTESEVVRHRAVMHGVQVGSAEGTRTIAGDIRGPEEAPQLFQTGSASAFEQQRQGPSPRERQGPGHSGPENR